MATPKPYSEDFENVSEFLDKNTGFLLDYLKRQPDVVNQFVVSTADQQLLQEWQIAIKERESEKQLKLKKVDYLPKRNTTLHQTDQYINKSLVVRRSGTFSLDLYFQEVFDPSKHKITLEFTIGPDPKAIHGTKLRLPLSESDLQKAKWSGKISKQDDELKKISVDVNIPSDAIIGRYKLTVEITSELEDGKKTERTTKPDVIVIFNPFSPGDDCYMDDAEERKEYVLSDTGLIFTSIPKVKRARDWLFGQFEEDILDISLKLLRGDNKTKLNPVKNLKKRSSPAYCSRMLTSMVNSCDNNGVLEGNWSGDYYGGTKPTQWNGSVKILRQWDRENASVKYGQCWVFSGVLTTVLRALGIPARSVTNFSSAHDTDANVSIDRFVDETGKTSDLLDSGDSIWNFHVWNEAYFKHSNIVKGYDGWQAVDATPQESSGGVMQCGPAPVKAIRNGEIYIGSDTNFIFSEVNADVMYWTVDSTGEVTGLVRRYNRRVGQTISTKAVGKDERLDVTSEYKYREGSKEERQAFDRAYAHAKKPDYHEKFLSDSEEIKIETSTVEDPVIGKTITTKVQVDNTTSENYDVTLTTVMSTLLNNEQKKGLVKKVIKEANVAAGKVYEEIIELTANEYWSQLVDDNVIRVTTTATVKQTKKMYIDTFDVHPEIPKMLKIECADKLPYDEEVELTLVITNELNTPLTEGVFEIESSGVVTKGAVKASAPIAPGETYRVSYNITPKRFGWKTLLADFDCKEFTDLKARKRVRIG